MSGAETNGVEAAIAEALATAGVDAALHARDVATDAEVDVRADADIALASVFKIPVLLEVLRQATAGELDLTDRIRIPPEGRAPGPSGLSVLVDEVEMSVRDLATSMMAVSDNAATDVLVGLVGLDRVQATVKELGLDRTFIRQDCRTLLDQMANEMGFERTEDLSSPEAVAAMADDPDGWVQRLAATNAVAPRETNQSTPRDVTRLLQLIWRDQAGPPAACDQARAIMRKQLFTMRLGSGFPDDILVAAKTGSLPFLKNEAGVLEYPDGRRYAVAVFSRSPVPGYRQPDQDRVIGTIARLAVDHLRATG